MPAVCHPCFEHSGKFGKHFCSCWLLLKRSSRDASHDSTVLLAELRAGSLDGYGSELFLPLDAVLAQLFLHRLDAISRNILCSRNTLCCRNVLCSRNTLCCSGLCLLSVCHHRISQDEQAAYDQFMFHNLLFILMQYATKSLRMLLRRNLADDVAKLRIRKEKDFNITEFFG